MLVALAVLRPYPYCCMVQNSSCTIHTSVAEPLSDSTVLKFSGFWSSCTGFTSCDWTVQSSCTFGCDGSAEIWHSLSLPKSWVTVVATWSPLGRSTLLALWGLPNWCCKLDIMFCICNVENDSPVMSCALNVTKFTGGGCPDLSADLLHFTGPSDGLPVHSNLRRTGRE